MSQIALYCGWYDEHVSGPFTRTNVEFLPGAFAYHLHSYSAHQLRSATQTWVGPLLARGATASMGCVDEPYLGGTPNLAVFMSRFLFLGFSFGESAYACQPVLSWQTTVVGDPLYRPFGKPPQQLQEELTQRHSPLLQWYWLRVANMNLARGTKPADIERFLNQIELTKQSAVLTEKLADLAGAEGKPSSAAELYQRALTLDPSPQQRVRLRLVLAEKLIALSREAEAVDDLAGILRENPDYPDQLGLYRRLFALAQKLGRPDAMARYETRIKELTPPPPPKTTN
jgi:tetratricopeptide (TPR) repeat protein